MAKPWDTLGRSSAATSSAGGAARYNPATAGKKGPVKRVAPDNPDSKGRKGSIDKRTSEQKLAEGKAARAAAKTAKAQAPKKIAPGTSVTRHKGSDQVEVPNKIRTRLKRDHATDLYRSYGGKVASRPVDVKIVPKPGVLPPAKPSKREPKYTGTPAKPNKSSLADHAESLKDKRSLVRASKAIGKKKPTDAQLKEIAKGNNARKTEEAKTTISKGTAIDKVTGKVLYQRPRPRGM